MDLGVRGAYKGLDQLTGAEGRLDQLTKSEMGLDQLTDRSRTYLDQLTL